MGQHKISVKQECLLLMYSALGFSNIINPKVLSIPPRNYNILWTSSVYFLPNIAIRNLVHDDLRHKQLNVCTPVHVSNLLRLQDSSLSMCYLSITLKMSSQEAAGINKTMCH